MKIRKEQNNQISKSCDTIKSMHVEALNHMKKLDWEQNQIKKLENKVTEWLDKKTMYKLGFINIEEFCYKSDDK